MYISYLCSFLKKYWFIYLAASGLNCFHVACGIFSCGMRTLSSSMWDLVPWPGIEPGPLHWKHGVLATGPPGKSLFVVFTMVSNYFVGIFSPTSDLEIKYIIRFKIDALLGSNFGKFIWMEIIRLILAWPVLFCFVLVQNTSSTACARTQPIAESFQCEAFSTSLTVY